MAATVGRVLLMEKGNYSGTSTYNALDWVRDNGAAWVCKVDGTIGIAPPTLPTTSNANWQVLAIDGSVSGSIAWSSVTSKPFDDIKAGGGLTVDASNYLELDVSMLTGSNISYDNTSSGMTASNVQDAIDELKAGGGGTTYTASKGVKIVSGDIRADLVSDTASSLASETRTATASREYAVELDSNSKLAVNVPWTDTTPNNGKLALTKGSIATNFYADQSGNTSVDLDCWSAESIVGVTNSAASGHVVFVNLDDSYGYDLYCEDTLIGISAMTKTGSGTSVTLDFEVTGATDGTTKCKLRILK